MRGNNASGTLKFRGRQIVLMVWPSAIIEWSIYARNCAQPNLKLMKVLEKLGFQVQSPETGSDFYWQRRSSNASLLRR